MGVSQLVNDFCRAFTSKIFRKLPLFPPPEDERLRDQEERLKEIAKLIGYAMHHSTDKHKTKDSIGDSIEKANDALREYLKDYCSVDIQGWHQKDMEYARATDDQVAKLIVHVEDELKEKVQLLQRKSAKTIDLWVNQWDSKSMHPSLQLISKKVKIEDDATLNMLIYRYMDYKLHFGDYERVDLQMLQLNPQIYEHFPVSKANWDTVIMKDMHKYIPCASPTTLIREFGSKGGHHRDAYMYLVYDRHDIERETQLTTGGSKVYRPNIDYTSAWFVKDCNYSAAVVRLNSLHHSLYYWDLGQRLLTHDEPFLCPSELCYVPLPPPTSPIPQPWHGSGNQGTDSAGTPPPNKGAPAPSAAPAPLTARNKTTPSSQPVLAVKKPEKAQPRLGQPNSQRAQPPRTNAVPSPASHAPGQGSANGASHSAPPKADVDSHPRRKAPLPANDKGGKQRNVGPDAWRMRPSTPVSPNGLVEDDNKRGGWFGSMVKSGLQKLGAYGSSSKS